MTAENFWGTLLVLLDRRPFEPFVVELHGGTRLEIDHARAIATREGTAIFVAPSRLPMAFDEHSVVRIIAAPAAAVRQSGEESHP